MMDDRGFEQHVKLSREETLVGHSVQLGAG